ncbi:MAG: hypothetical protein LBL75_03065 [Rickettsiales bacterium]|jgi:hypothetical protein|nr:hypothetical protein [Rickettsiales bacterium]
MPYNSESFAAEQKKLRDIFLSGNPDGVFPNGVFYDDMFATDYLKFNLSPRLKFYNNPQKQDKFFTELFNKLQSAHKTINHYDAYDMQKILGLVYPKKSIPDTQNLLTAILNDIEIPEGHFYVSETEDDTLLFTRLNKVFISRYAGILLMKHLLKQNKSFYTDKNAELFVSEPAQSDFIEEITAAALGYYFAYPKSEHEQIINATMDWVRGNRLRKFVSKSAQDLRQNLMAFPTLRKSPHNIEEFKQEFIFNPLFGANTKNSFMKQYEVAIQNMGFIKNKDAIWEHAGKTLPKYPGQVFTPWAQFIIGWAIKKFNQFLITEKPTKISELENLARNFFAAIYGGMVKSGMNLSQKFTDNRIIDSYKHTTQISNQYKILGNTDLFDTGEKVWVSLRDNAKTPQKRQEYNKYLYNGIDLDKFIRPENKSVADIARPVNSTQIDIFYKPATFITCDKYGPNEYGEFQMMNAPLSKFPTPGHKTIRSQDNCSFDFFLYEFDDFSIEQQTEIMTRLATAGVLYRAVYSGSKSIHLLVRAKYVPNTIDEYKFCWKYIVSELDLYGADTLCNDNSRMTRRPGVIREQTGKLQEQLYLNEYAYFTKNWRTAYEKSQNQKVSMIFSDSVNSDFSEFGWSYIGKHNLTFGDGNWHGPCASVAGAFYVRGYSFDDFAKFMTTSFPALAETKRYNAHIKNFNRFFQR